MQQRPSNAAVVEVFCFIFCFCWTRNFIPNIWWRKRGISCSNPTLPRYGIVLVQAIYCMLLLLSWCFCFLKSDPLKRRRLWLLIDNMVLYYCQLLRQPLSIYTNTNMTFPSLMPPSSFETRISNILFSMVVSVSLVHLFVHYYSYNYYFIALF